MAPKEWIVSRICEEFSIPPDVALRQDAELCFTIMGDRAFSQAVTAVEAKGSDEENTTPWQREVVFDVVEEIGKLGKR